ncbi:hypothetical protein [Bacillus xiapuensis]|uniref:hypothetical protein n=1 Tax=Bacillus xiapuensis TaxID=2014075 RepID=UPI000C2386C0|nr:hypothetical protein [Bacillus xiapuensis]
MIDITKAVTVSIGRRGEHHYRNIEFDVSGLLEEKYPSASLNAIFKRPDGIAYPVVTSYADGILTWSPSATDTSIVGVGRLEIRVTYGDVVGKSIQILTIVEDALVDGIAEPPEPPAQEWLNQVLSALAELDINETYNLLNLIYSLLNNNYDLLNTTHGRLNDTYGLVNDNYAILNTTHSLLNDNYNLLNTTHGLIEDMRDTLYTRTGIILNHLHPIETATAPDMVSRRASITFTSINSGNNVVLGTVTYTFVTSLGSPTTNNVQVLIQGTLRNTVKKLAEAIRGIQDVANIAYGSGTSPNPASTAYWTSRVFSIGDATIPSGESLFILERAENATTPLALTSTATSTINAFTRASYLRYVLSGNATGGGGINSVRGPLYTLLPIGSVVIGGQGGLLYPTAYDCHLVTLCRQSDTSEKELDLYISNDEVNFTRISRSTPIGADSSNAGLHIHIQMRQSRVPSGYGLYISMGSDGTSANAFCDLKFTYHLYPVALASDTNS